MAKSEGISEKEALKLIKVRDAERIDFIRHYFNHTPWEAEDYDLVLNSGRFDVDQLAKIVLFAYEQKIGKVLPGKN